MQTHTNTKSYCKVGGSFLKLVPAEADSVSIQLNSHLPKQAIFLLLGTAEVFLLLKHIIIKCQLLSPPQPRKLRKKDKLF